MRNAMPLLLAVTAALAPLAVRAQEPGPGEIVRLEFTEAENAGDLDRIRGLLHEDVVYALPGETPTFGREATMQLLRIIVERFDYSTVYAVQAVESDAGRLVEHGTVSMTFVPRQGGESGEMTVPCAFESVATADGWKVRTLLLGSTGPVADLVPSLPAPTGPHPVGVRSMILVDDSRADPFFPSGAREVGIEVWYPARPGKDEETRPYLSEECASALATFLDQSATFSAFMPHVRTHSVQDAEAVPGAWPVILYNHGYSGFTGVHQALCEELASQGFVVASVGHAHESALFVGPDGSCKPFDRNAEPHRNRLEEAANPVPEAAKDRILRAENREQREASYRELLALSPFHQESTRIWADDSRFVLDRLAAGLADITVDPGRVGAIGHSLGGATAGQLAIDEPRVRAIVNLDGFQFGDLLGSPLEIPSMFMGARRSWSGDQLIANDVFFEAARAPSWIVVFDGFAHASFTDLCVFGMAPGVGEGEGAGETAMQLQRDYVLAFFDLALRNRLSARLDPAGPHHPAVQIERRN
jgi:dienelactone hydrolase